MNSWFLIFHVFQFTVVITVSDGYVVSSLASKSPLKWDPKFFWHDLVVFDSSFAFLIWNKN